MPAIQTMSSLANRVKSVTIIRMTIALLRIMSVDCCLMRSAAWCFCQGDPGVLVRVVSTAYSHATTGRWIKPGDLAEVSRSLLFGRIAPSRRSVHRDVAIGSVTAGFERCARRSASAVRCRFARTLAGAALWGGRPRPIRLPAEHRVVGLGYRPDVVQVPAGLLKRRRILHLLGRQAGAQLERSVERGRVA